MVSREEYTEYSVVNPFWEYREYLLLGILGDQGKRSLYDLIAEVRRGVPPDCSPEYKREVEKWGENGHSHNWLLLSELLAFDWSKGVDLWPTNPEEWCAFHFDDVLPVPVEEVRHRAWGSLGTELRVEDFCAALYLLQQDVGAPVDPRRNPEHMKMFCSLLGDESDYHCLVRCGYSYAEELEAFVTMTIPRLQALSRSATFDDVWIVFFFDN